MPPTGSRFAKKKKYRLTFHVNILQNLDIKYFDRNVFIMTTLLIYGLPDGRDILLFAEVVLSCYRHQKWGMKILKKQRSNISLINEYLNS